MRVAYSVWARWEGLPGPSPCWRLEMVADRNTFPWAGGISYPKKYVNSPECWSSFPTGFLRDEPTNMSLKRELFFYGTFVQHFPLL